MEITFVHLNGFTREWKRCGLNDDDLQAVEAQLMENPEAGAVMRGTGGLRKVRFARPSSRAGKSGTHRVGYAYFRIADTILLATVFAKSDQANLSDAEKAEFKKIIDGLKPKF